MLTSTVYKIFAINLLAASGIATAGDLAKIAFLSSYKTHEPKTYKDDEHAFVTIEGAIPLTCLELTTPVVIVDAAQSRITITPRATYQSRRCEENPRAWQQEVNLGILRAGMYMIIVGINGQPQILTIKPDAPNA